MPSDSLKIVLPLPAKELSPNGGTRHHPRKIARLVKEAKQTAYYCAYAVLGGYPRDWPRAQLIYRVYRTSKTGAKLSDDDNSIRWGKHYRDGIAKAFGVDDRGWTVAGVEHHADKFNPRFEIEVVPCCHLCGKDMSRVNGGVGNVTHDGKLWCGCPLPQGGDPE